MGIFGPEDFRIKHSWKPNIVEEDRFALCFQNGVRTLEILAYVQAVHH
jgi:hypothetical protein